MLFLLKSDQGRALLIAQAKNQDEADRFGRHHLPQFCGRSIEIDSNCREDAEEFWGVRTVRLVNVLLDPTARRVPKPEFEVKHLWSTGLELPEEVEKDDLLTSEDRAALTIDHMQRTCNVIAQLKIFKVA